MDNSQFLSYFWDLSDDKSKEQIVNAAESIVNLVESKQKLEKAKEFNKDKYKLYLNICENPTEDILYTTKRLVQINLILDWRNRFYWCQCKTWVHFGFYTSS
jgi:hypothetical protein